MYICYFDKFYLAQF